MRAVPLLASLGVPSLAAAQPADASSAAETPGAGAAREAQEAAPAPPVAAQPTSEVMAVSGGLLAVDAARRAASTSVQAAIEQQQVNAARAQRSQVIWDAAPRLTLSASTTLLSKVDSLSIPAGPMTPGFSFPPIPRYNHLLNARLSVPLSDYLFRLARALRSAGANEEAASLEERAARVSAGANAKLAYYDWVRARLANMLSIQAHAQAQAQLTRVRALQGVGRVAEADVLQAVAFEAEAALALTQAQTDAALAEERLRLSIHAAPGEALSVGEDVLAPFTAAEEAQPLDALYREALQKRLEIAAIERGKAALEDAEGIESSRAYPRVEAVGNVTYANPNQRIFPQEQEWNGTWDVGVQAVWSLNDLGTSGARATVVQTQLGELIQRRASFEESVRLEVLAALSALNQARAGVTTAEQGERAARAAFEARERLQAQGLGTALELIQAETARIRARFSVINAHIGLRVARVQLDHAVGRDIAELEAL